MATKTMLSEKVADINRLINHKFTDEELNEKLRKQGALNNKANTVKRAETERKIEAAMAAGDDAEVERLQAEAASLLPPKLAFTNNNPKPQVKKQSEHERLAELNLRNQKLNYENVRRAQLEERKASRKAAAAVARGRWHRPELCWTCAWRRTRSASRPTNSSSRSWRRSAKRRRTRRSR